MKRNNAAEYARKMLGIDQEAEQGQAVQPEQPEVKEEAEKKSKPDKPKKYFINIDLTGYKGYLANMASVNETTINGYVRSLVEADANKPENRELNEALEKFKAIKGKK